MTTLLTPSPMISRLLASGVRIGSQTPLVRNVPPYVKTYGNEVIDFMSQVGRPLDPWQADVQLGAHGVRQDGLWSAFEDVIDLARQNGKGGATEGIELGGVFLFREPLILHSAHQFKTSTAAFRRLIDIIDASDWLTRRVKMISRSKGDESIQLTRAAGGGMIQFVARTLGSGRGLTGSTTVFDEAAWLTVGQYAAQTPALATIPNPRIVYTSTPPDDDVGPMPGDAMLPSVRKRGLRGGGRTAMWEWRPPDKFDRADRNIWYLCNPALGIRISEEFLARQLEAFTDAGHPEKFDTEHLGKWANDADEQWLIIPEAEWGAAAVEGGDFVKPLAFSLEVSLERTEAAICSAARRPDGLRQVGVTQHRPGTTWTVDWLIEQNKSQRPCAVVVDAGGPAGSLIADLEAGGVEVLKPSVRDYAAACNAFKDGVAGVVGDGQDPAVVRNVRHPDQIELNAGVAGLTTRKVGDSTVFERAGKGFIACGAALALWGHSVRAPKPYDPLGNLW